MPFLVDWVEIMQSDIKTLALAILECVKHNDLDGLRPLLAHPLAREAVGHETLPWETPGCLIVACREKKADFVIALLPYCDVDGVALVLIECLNRGQVDMCDIIVEHREDIAHHLDPSTLIILAGLYHQLLEHPVGFNPINQRVALQWFLEWAPQEVVQQQLHNMKVEAQQNPDDPPPFGLVEEMLAERQKQLLEDNIEGEVQVGVARKM